MARRLKNKILPGQMALSRARAALGPLTDNVKIALAIEAAMEAANDQIKGKDITFPVGSATFQMLHQCMAMSLALTLSRIYDISGRWPIVEQDKASLPVLVHLVRQPNCKAVLILQGAGDQTSTSLERLLCGYVALLKKHETRHAVRRLRDFRNKRLAHSLQTEVTHLPAYKDLFLLVDHARDMVEAAQIAIEGNSLDFGDDERAYRDDADSFWEPVVKVLQTEDDLPLPSGHDAPGSRYRP